MTDLEMEGITVEWLYRKLENTISDEENVKVEKWLEVPAHQVYFRNLQRFYQLSEHTAISEQELNEAWEIMRKRIAERRGRHVKQFLQRIAVASSLVIGVGLWVLFSKESVSVSGEAQTIAISPGKYNAVLELSDGKKYDLKKDNRINNKIKDHIVVDSGCLNYSGQDMVGPEELSHHKLIVPRGGEFQIVLADGTKVWVNAESQLKYPEVFSGKFREVYLEGEAYFEVAKKPEQPFIVYSGIQKITALGTGFGVSCYSDEQGLATTLVEGKVKVEYPGVIEQVFTLEPGYRIFYDFARNRIEQKKVDTREFVAWKDGKYVFTRKRLEDMLNTLSRWYDFQVFYQNQEVKEVLFSGELMRFGNFNDMLRLIEKSSDVKFAVKEHVVVVSK